MKKPRGAPETAIRARIKRYLEQRGWLVMVTHGSQFQSGFPDLYAAHLDHGPRWIEIKYAMKYKFTAAQLHWFPRLDDAGVGVWVLTEADYDQYMKLFRGANWRDFLKPGELRAASGL